MNNDTCSRAPSPVHKDSRYQCTAAYVSDQASMHSANNHVTSLSGYTTPPLTPMKEELHDIKIDYETPILSHADNISQTPAQPAPYERSFQPPQPNEAPSLQSFNDHPPINSIPTC